METHRFDLRSGYAGPRVRAFSKSLPFKFSVLPGLLVLLLVQSAAAAKPYSVELGIPETGEHALQILSPNLLELFLVNTKQPDPARVDTWDWVNAQRTFIRPDMSRLTVIVDGKTNAVSKVGFKRRALYAPLLTWDLRIGNQLYLRLSNAIPEGASVQVLNNGTLWPTNLGFASVADPLRYNPAIHVNQEGYLPAYPKTGGVGY